MAITLKLTLGSAFDEAAEQLEAMLQPVGAIEVLFAAQIIRAGWRLKRCEAAIEPDSQDIDRIRQRAELSIRRNLAELRQLQADRHLKLDLHLDLPGVIRVKDVLNLKKRTQTDQPPPPTPPAIDMETRIATLLQEEQEAHAAVSRPGPLRTFPKPPTPARNAPCLCGSGIKYKRCHGQSASPSQLGEPLAA